LRLRAIVIIVGIILVIGAVALFQNPKQTPPLIKDEPDIIETTNMHTSTSFEDKPEILESANIQVENETEFTVNDDGTKTYIINAVDTPAPEG